MDGRLAVLFFLLSGGDAAVNYCDQGCLRPLTAERRLTFGGSQVQFQDDDIGSELYLGYDMGRRFGPVQLTTAFSVTDQGDTWVGFGGKWSGHLGNFVLESQFLPGLYFQGGGPDIGTMVEFRSGIAAGYEFSNGGRLVVSYDHRSNADLSKTNPGLETIGIRYSISWK